MASSGLRSAQARDCECECCEWRNCWTERAGTSWERREGDRRSGGGYKGRCQSQLKTRTESTRYIERLAATRKQGQTARVTGSTWLSSRTRRISRTRPHRLQARSLSGCVGVLPVGVLQCAQYLLLLRSLLVLLFTGCAFAVGDCSSHWPHRLQPFAIFPHDSVLRNSGSPFVALIYSDFALCPVISAAPPCLLSRFPASRTRTDSMSAALAFSRSISRHPRCGVCLGRAPS